MMKILNFNNLMNDIRDEHFYEQFDPLICKMSRRGALNLFFDTQ